MVRKRLLKIIALYEQEKMQNETNQQKFDELARYFDVTTQDIKLKEIGSLLGNNENMEETAEENKQAMDEIIEKDELKKKEAKALNKSLINQNFFFTLGLYLDKDIQRNRNTDLRLAIEEILKNKVDIKNDKDYQEFKKQIPNLQDRLFFKGIRTIASRAKRIARDFEINEQSLKNEEFRNLFTCSKAKYHSFLEETNAMRAIKNGCNSEYDSNIKTVINVEMYKKIYQNFDVGGNYTRRQIHEICKGVYGKFTHKPISKNIAVSLVQKLFNTTETQITVYDDNGGKRRVRHLHFDAKNTYEKSLQKFGIAGWQKQMF